MSSPETNLPDERFINSAEYNETPIVISIYAPAIYGQETVREDLKEALDDKGFQSIRVVEDAEDQDDVINLYYYGDEDEVDINWNDVLEVVKGFDKSAYIK